MNEEQKQWLKTHFDIDVDKLPKNPLGTTRKVGVHFIEFYEAKEKAVKIIGDLVINPNTRALAVLLQKEIQNTETSMKVVGEKLSGDEKEFNNELKAALKKLSGTSEIAEEAKTHLDEFMKIRGRIHENTFKVREAANKFESELREIEGNLQIITDEFRDIELNEGKLDKKAYQTAIANVSSLEKESKKLLESAGQHIQKKAKFDEQAKIARQHYEILRATPHANYNKLESMLVSAAMHVKALDYETALEVLKDHTKVYESALKAAKEQQEKVNKNEAATDLVINRLEELDAFFQRINELPGLHNWIVVQQGSLDTRRKLANNGDYATAWKDLNHFSWTIPELQKKAQEQSNQTTEKGFKEYPAVKQAYEDCKLVLKKLEAVATEAEYLKALGLPNQDMDSFLDSINAGKKADSVEKAKKCEQALRTRITELNERIKVLNGANEECVSLLNKITNWIERLRVLAHSDDLAIYEFRWKQLQGGLSLRDFENIQKSLEKLAEELEKFYNDYTKHSEEWAEKFKENSDYFSKAIETIGECPVTKSFAEDKKKEWGAIQELAKQKRPDQALDRMVTLKLEVLQLLNQVDTRKKSDEAIRIADADLSKEFEELATLISDLKSSVAKLRGKDETSTDTAKMQTEFDASLKELQQNWDDSRNAALHLEDLPIKESKKKCADLRAKVQGILLAPDAMQKLVATQVLAEKQKAFSAVEQKARIALDKWMEIESQDALLSKKEVDSIASRANDNYDVATSEMTKQLREIELAILTREQLAKIYGQAVINWHKDTVEAISEAKEKLSRSLQSSIASHFARYFETLNAEVEDIKKSTVGNPNIGALEAASEYFRTIFEKMKQLIQSQSSGANEFELVQDLITELSGDTLVGNKNLSVCLPSKKAVFDERLKGYSTSSLSLDPTDALAQLKTFKTEVEQAINDASFAQNQRDTFKQNKKTALLKLKSLPEDLEYRGNLQTKIEALESKVNTEGKEAVASSELSTLLVEIDRAINDPEFRNAKNKDVIFKRIETEKKKQLWESRLSLFDTLFKEASKALSIPEADVSQRNELDKMKKEAQKNAKSTNYDLAIKQIGLAIAHARDVIKNPLGEKVTSRNNLPEDLKRFQAAVGSFNKSIKAISERISEETGLSVEKHVVDTANGLLDKLTYQFDMQILDSEINILSGKGGELAKRRAAKEKALAKIRDYQKFFDKDPVLRKILDNPFELDSRASLDLVRISLNSLDVNLRRCI